MVDNTSAATKSALTNVCFNVIIVTRPSSRPLAAGLFLVPPASSHNPFPAAPSTQPGSGGMKLEAVMETLQRQQAARLALEEKLRQAEKEEDLRSMMESQIHQQALAFRHYQAAMRGALAAGVANSSPGGTLPHMEVRRPAEDRNSSRTDSDDNERDEELDDIEEQEVMEEEEDENDVGLNHYQHRQSSLQAASLSPKSAQMHLMSRVPAAFAPARGAESPSVHPQPQHHEWTYEEQFKQVRHLDLLTISKLGNSSGGGSSEPLIQELYELDDDEKRKEFLDDLFSFMQKRGTPVNRIPIMAKQVLDLYMLYKLVTEKGGLVEVINKKIWREITKGLNLPTSITSAAFTLRTQYMKYLYPYECEKRGLSSPGELQAAIDSNRREGRRQSYGSAIFSYSPVGTPTLLSSPKIQMSHLPVPTHNSGHISQVPVIKKAGWPSTCRPVAIMQQAAAAQAAAAMQAAALEQLREKLESSEPPEKKMMIVAEEQQKLMQHTLQQNLLAMATQLPLNIKLNNRGKMLTGDDRQETALNLSTNGISSINMSIEINGVVYTGKERGRKHSNCQTQAKTSSAQFQPSCSSSSSSLHGNRNSSP
uniref:AT-rich interactive domain-containing protein 3 n=1 Tax=Monopterus albus TaxID=43700 RepID=A0A3Q3J2A3_MONAL